MLYNLHAKLLFSAIFVVLNINTETCRLQVLTLQLLVAAQDCFQKHVEPSPCWDYDILMPSVGVGTSTVAAVGYCNWRALTECLVINFHYVIIDVQHLYAALKNKLISLKFFPRCFWDRPYSQAIAISDSIFH